jgi:hypothetical protein
MDKLTAFDLRNLIYGERVYRFDGKSFRGLRFVGLMPDCKNYLIFCDGEYLTHLYISEKDESFHDEWYSGEYSSMFVGGLLLAALEKRKESIINTYIKEE